MHIMYNKMFSSDLPTESPEDSDRVSRGIVDVFLRTAWTILQISWQCLVIIRIVVSKVAR